jgi:amidase
VEEVAPPELARVNEIWARVLVSDLQHLLPLMAPIMSEGTLDALTHFVQEIDPAAMNGTQLYLERDRLAVAWSAFFQQYPLVVGPTWADLPFLHDADIDPDSGMDTMMRRLQFITPGNLLGIPAVALPMGVVDGLPTGVQIYADRWREDLCLDAAGLIEARVGHTTPIDPKF